MTRKRDAIVDEGVASAPVIASLDLVGNANADGTTVRVRQSVLSLIFQDSKKNSRKIRCFLVLFRIASLFESRKKVLFHRAMYMLANSAYTLFSDLFTGIELPAGTPVGRNLTIHHGFGIVVGKGACIKDNVILRQGVTIGNFVDRAGRVVGDPVIESGVEFGAGACALGAITVGEGAFIGANCVVYRDVPAHTRVYPGRSVFSSQRLQVKG